MGKIFLKGGGEEKNDGRGLALHRKASGERVS